MLRGVWKGRNEVLIYEHVFALSTILGASHSTITHV